MRMRSPVAYISERGECVSSFGQKHSFESLSNLRSSREIALTDFGDCTYVSVTYDDLTMTLLVIERLSVAHRQTIRRKTWKDIRSGKRINAPSAR